MTRPVPRIGRLLDGVAALLIVAGAALWGRAFFGLDALRGRAGADYVPGMTIDRMAEYQSWVQLSWVGMSLAVAGIATAVAAALVARRALLRA